MIPASELNQVKQAISEIVESTNDVWTAAALGFQNGTVHLAEIILEELRYDLSPNLRCKIKDLLKEYDRAAPYGVTVVVKETEPMPF